jgi:hypothetical protein
MIDINITTLNKSMGRRGGNKKEKEENPVSKCSHVLILWLNLEGTKFNNM